MTTESSKPLAPDHQEATPAHASSSEPPEPPAPRRSYWLQITLFAVALSIGLYPYLKQQVPFLEKLIQPSRYYQRLGHQSFQQHYYQQAIEQYRQALLYKGVMSGLQGRERSATEYQIARCYMQLRRYSRAIHYARRSQETSPDWLPPYILVVDLYTQLNQSEPFHTYAELLKKRFPNNWNVWVMLGNGYRRLQQEDKAIHSYEQAVLTIQRSLQALTQDSSEYASLQQRAQTLQTQLQSLKASKVQQMQAAAVHRQEPPAPPPPSSQPAPSPSSQPAPPQRVASTGNGATAPHGPAGSQRGQTRTTPTPTSFPIFRMHRAPIPIPRIRTHRRSQRLLLPPVPVTRLRK